MLCAPIIVSLYFTKFPGIMMSQEICLCATVSSNTTESKFRQHQQERRDFVEVNEWLTDAADKPDRERGYTSTDDRK